MESEGTEEEKETNPVRKKEQGEKLRLSELGLEITGVLVDGA